MSPRRRRRRIGATLLVAWSLLWVASSVTRLLRPAPEPPGDRLLTSVPVFAADGGETGDRTGMAWLEWEPGADDDDDPVEAATGRLPVVLLHGSPGDAANFRSLAPRLAGSRGALAPDLPGFGGSSAHVPDYSIVSHARYVLAWMDAIGLPRAHFVGFSMGGGVGLHVWELAPERVASLTMLSAIGVQEMELLGDYHLNHLLHGAQLVALEGIRLMVPHFGVLDHGMLDYAYERNFYDTDQRPLRALLESFDPPMLILHGRRDPLVPVEAAVEHARIVPQSRLVLRADSHFFVFRPDSDAAETMAMFLRDVEEGTAPHRRDADPERLRLAAAPFDPASLPDWEGPALLVVLLLIVLATFVSEDLTLIGTGLLVAQGRIGYMPAATAAFVGIVVGDALLFWAGRVLGRRIVRRRPFSWWISRQAIRESSIWLRRRGAIVILVTRVLPGTRLPTNVAAGILRTSAWRFLGYFALAGVFWTFPVVWTCARLGEHFLPQLSRWRWRLLIILLALGALMWLTRKLVLPLVTWRGRRRLLGAWRFRTRWEFWPSAAIYLPLVPWFLWLALKHRGLTVFTSANPAIPAGGFVGESKSRILADLPQEVVPEWTRIPPAGPDDDLDARLRALQRFARAHRLGWPLVVKPDVGERGRGVLVAGSWAEVRRHLRRHPGALIGQRFVEGREFSVFWMRSPGDDEGTLYSVTVKRRPTVVGDGRRTLWDLILADERAVALASVYDAENPGARERIPAAGEVVALTSVGAHCRGTLFEDGSHLRTDALRRAIDRIATAYGGGREDGGFDFGRFDLITGSEEDLMAGRNLRVIELNGITSESTNMYDPGNGLIDAWRILGDQWDRCFAIGARRRALGVTPVGALHLLREWRAARS